jgi:hypothetical protein
MLLKVDTSLYVCTSQISHLSKYIKQLENTTNK